MTIQKSRALQNALSAKGLRTWTVDNLEITVARDPVVYDDGRLELWLAVKRNGVPIELPVGAQPFLFVNPPLIHGGSENPLEAVRKIALDALAQYL